MISILIPVKNAAPFLEACLESIAAQSQAGFEAIFADDHSTDASRDIIGEWSRRDARIRLVVSGGHGILPALRAAFAASRGECITRMDADDLMPPGKLATLYELLRAAGPGHVATGKVRYFSQDSVGAGYRRYETWLNGLMESGNHYEDIYRECVIPSAAFMVYRTDLERIGGFGAGAYPEDYDLAFRFYRAGYKIVAADQVVHLWRDHPGRTSRTDPKYAGPYYDLKVRYFLELDRDPRREMVLIGAGPKGKPLAQMLLARDIRFRWLTDNRRKQGSSIYGVKLESEQAWDFAQGGFQYLVAISSPAEVQALEARLAAAGLRKGQDIFWMC